MNPRTRRRRRLARKWSQERNVVLQPLVMAKSPCHDSGTLINPRARWQTLPRESLRIDLGERPRGHQAKVNRWLLDAVRMAHRICQSILDDLMPDLE